MGKISSIPSAAIVALIVLVASWLEQFFPNALWLAGTLGVLGALVKMVEVFWPAPPPSDTERMMAAQPDTFGRKVLRVFLG